MWVCGQTDIRLYESESSDIQAAFELVDWLPSIDCGSSTVEHWTPFSTKVVLEANRKLAQRRQGDAFALPRELIGIIHFKPKTTEEIRAAFSKASRRLREGDLG
jgi:hypothetical protein